MKWATIGFDEKLVFCFDTLENFSDELKGSIDNYCKDYCKALCQK